MDKKILVIGNGQSVLLRDLYKNVNIHSKQKLSIDLFSLNKANSKNEIFRNVYSFPSFIFRIKNPNLAFILKVIYLKIFTLLISERYNTVHMHYIQNLFNHINIKRIADKSVITVWGSDFLRRNKNKRHKLISLIEKVDLITCGNISVLKEIGEYYKLKDDKLKLTPFGFEALDYIEKYKSRDKRSLKQLFNIPEDSICISLGYNADLGQQHEKIIESIKSNRKLLKLRDKLFFVVPMTYGERTHGYIKTIENILKDFPFDYIVLKDFMNAETIAQFRLASDILIQVQITDLLAGSMQEHLCAGNIVITGKWLPYQELKSKGVIYKEVNCVEVTGEVLYMVINNLNNINTDSNFDNIIKRSSWKHTTAKWLKLYQ